MSSQSGIHDRPEFDNSVETAANALAVVSQELMETIRNSHLALEDCVDGRGGTAALVRCGQLLHQASGALKLTETYGAALLAEEMESVCTYLATLRAGKGREDGLDALTRAMVQLPIYIERLLGGGRDIALVLLPMLNDLRAARGQPLLSEGTLLLLNLSPQSKPATRGSNDANGEDPIFVARKLRPKFQLALLGWIQGGNNQRHLQTLSSVIQTLENCANRDDMYQLWWVVGGVLESLQNGGLETSVALKRLLGQTDRQIKRMIDEGLPAFDNHLVTDLLNNLLYYVARSSHAGERISEIRAAVNLAEWLPGDEQVEHAREALSAPSVKLMKTVAGAIKENLGRVKDVLDIFVRTGMNNAAELLPQLDLLRKISDTLGVLGLGELRGDIDSEIDSLKNIVSKGGPIKEKTIIEIASTLLRVEDRLDQQLVRLIVPSDPAANDEYQAEIAPEEDADYQQVAEAVMRESIINLARIKETFSQSMVSKGSSMGLDSVPALIRGIKAGLMMLNKSRATEIVDRVGQLLILALSGTGPARLTQKETDRLADAIVSIEYYMETVKAGRSEPWYMLDNAEACLAVLRDLEARLVAEQSAQAVAPPAETASTSDAEESGAADDQSPVATVALENPDSDALGIVRPPETLRATTVMPAASVVLETSEHLDPELLELFIEEAKEEITTISRNLPQWAERPDDMETLITVRRSFHTLKGSGRMVGAERIGEYAWSIESLLNRLINKTLVRIPPMIDFILQAADALPELVEQLEIGTPPGRDISLIMARANAFAEGDPNAAILTIARSPEEQAPEPVVALEMDPVLLDIFSKETTGHLKVIYDYLNACEGHQPPFHVTDRLHRACHTLHGSANMANVERGVLVAGALNRYVRRNYDFKIGLVASGSDALRAAAKALETIVGDINQPDRPRADFSVLIEHLMSLTNGLTQPQVKEDTAVVEVIKAPELPAEIVDEPAYDAEIAAIFSEEAAELLEGADQALSGWKADRNARDHIEALKRHLHTLKGGARMADILPMGDLSHEIEALLMNVDDGRISAAPQIDELLQQSIDELHRMRDSVIAGKAVTAATDLEQRIHAINAGETPTEPVVPSPAPDTDGVESSEATEFTIEPEDALSMIILDSPAEEEVFESALEIADTTDLADSVEETSVPIVGLPKMADLEEEAEPAIVDPPSAAEPPAPESRLVMERRAESRPAPARGSESRQEFARIDAELLEDLLNAAGEISIYHSRLSQQINSIEFHVEEMEQTVARLRGQLRKLDIETEAQIMHGHQDTQVVQDFDPLELDRYSNIQQLSRALAESASDMGSLKDLLQTLISEADTLLVQQSRVTAELQDGLMRTRMVPFQQHVPRLTRLVRQAAAEAGKQAELAVEGASGELDRQVLEKMLPPFEHMMRNAIVHGIEEPHERQAVGKPASGRITIRLHREGAEMVIDVADDGAGLDVESIRRNVFEKGLLQADSTVTDDAIMDLILTPGFSTAESVTQSAGCGVGMDVVANEIKQLGGSLQISSVMGQGTNFTIRLPFTLAITQALVVRAGPPVVELKNAAPTPVDERPIALVVDDSITVRRVTEKFLDRNGIRAMTAKDGLDAIRVLQDAKPDIILLDIEMPNMDGYEFATHVRNDVRIADVPIIMITSRVGDKHRARAIEIGINDYLGKPYQDSQLLEAIRRLLDERGVTLP